MPSSKATGADGISAVNLLQAGIKELVPSISKLINMSFGLVINFPQDGK
jgi:hypothetical protein